MCSAPDIPENPTLPPPAPAQTAEIKQQEDPVNLSFKRRRTGTQSLQVKPSSGLGIPK